MQLTAGDYLRMVAYPPIEEADAQWDYTQDPPQLVKGPAISGLLYADARLALLLTGDLPSADEVLALLDAEDDPRWEPLRAQQLDRNEPVQRPDGAYELELRHPLAGETQTLVFQPMTGRLKRVVAASTQHLDVTEDAGLVRLQHATIGALGGLTAESVELLALGDYLSALHVLYFLLPEASTTLATPSG